VGDRYFLLHSSRQCLISAGPSLGGGTIGDMFKREERGGAQAVYGFGPTFGPALGGLIGGYISERV
jgi:MFS family permease